MILIKKFLLSVEDKELIIKVKEVNSYAPINRILDDVGLFALDSIRVNGIDYLFVYDPIEENTVKTKILVSRTLKGSIVNMEASDMNNMIQIAIKYFNYTQISVN